MGSTTSVQARSDHRWTSRPPTPPAVTAARATAVKRPAAELRAAHPRPAPPTRKARAAARSIKQVTTTAVAARRRRARAHGGSRSSFSLPAAAAFVGLRLFAVASGCFVAACSSVVAGRRSGVFGRFGGLLLAADREHGEEREREDCSACHCAARLPPFARPARYAGIAVLRRALTMIIFAGCGGTQPGAAVGFDDFCTAQFDPPAEREHLRVAIEGWLVKPGRMTRCEDLCSFELAEQADGGG